MNLNRLIVAGFLAVPLLARAMPARVQVFEAAARSAPQPSAPAVHVFVEGAEVFVSEERFGTFRKVRVPGGRTAFVDERALAVGPASSGARPAGERSELDATPVAAPARWAVVPLPMHQPLAAAPLRAAAPSAEPASAPADLYAVVKVGGYAPQHEDLRSFGTGVDGELVLGTRFTPNLAAEAAVGWFRTTADGADGAEGTLSMVPITATGKIILPASQIELYGLAGAGAYFAAYEETGAFGSARGGATALGFHLGAGAALKVTPAASVGAEVRYLLASGALSGDYAGKLHLNGLRFAATLEYRF